MDNPLQVTGSRLSSEPPEADTSSAHSKDSDKFPSPGPPVDLRRKTVRSGLVTVLAQAANFCVYTVSTMVLARLLSPEDFGLVGMVTAVTGFLRVFKDAGLSVATVQREVITHEQISTLFWVNMVVGILLAIVSLVLAPLLAIFYREPRLIWITVAMGASFVFGAASAQHEALLRRQMRFKALAAIEMISLAAGICVGIGMALNGFGYWALVAMPIATALANLVAVWTALSWRPGPPRRGSGARAMLHFGASLAGVNLLNYLWRNADNVLIGWHWGAGPLGFYQKAYGLLLLPINQVNSPISGVAVSSLCRVQGDPERLRRYFIGGYTMAASITLPIVLAVTVFADDIITLLLGGRWFEAVGIFRLLAPAALIGALLNPMGWLFVATGRADRQFKLTVVWSALVVLAFVAGLGYGPQGVAIGYSAMTTLLALPVLKYATKGTSVRLHDIFAAIKAPILAAAVSGALGLLLKISMADSIPVALRAIGGCFAVTGAYALILLVLVRQWDSYRTLLREALPRTRSSEV